MGSVVSEYFNYIFGTNSHLQGICIPEKLKSKGALVLFVLCIKSGCGIYTSILRIIIIN